MKKQYRSHPAPVRVISGFLAVSMGLFTASPVAWALPSGESVAQGDVTFDRSGKELTITQSSSKAVINYGNFDIHADESVRFVQPGASAAALNRIGGAATSIAGSLSANGQIYLVTE